MNEEPPRGEVVRQAWRAWKMHSNPLSVFWLHWQSFLDHQLVKRQAELQAHRQWQARILSRALSGWTEYRQQREAAANLLRQWKEKRALEDLRSPAVQASPRFSINQDFPRSFGPLGSASGQAGLELLATSLGALFEDLQVKNGGDLVIKVLGSGQGPSSREENVDLSQESEWPPSAVLYANACIVCQRVPYVAAAVRFASQKLDQRLLSSTKSSSEAAPFATLFLSGEECSAAGVRAVLEWAYTGAFAARDWRQLAEVLRAGSYLGVTEVVQLSQEALLRLAAPVGRELERVGRSQAVRGLWESVSGALVSDWDLATGRLNPLHSKLNERLSVEKDGVPLFVRNQAKKRYIEDQDSKNASSFSTDRASLGGSAGFPKEAADFVVEGLTVLSSCGEEGTASRFLESACPSLESVLLMLLHLDLRIVSSVLGMLLERLDHLRGSAGQRTGSNEVPLNDLSGEGKLDAGVLVVLHRWWGVNPSERLALARALLGEHVCLGALGISTLEELIAQCRKAAVEGLGGAKNSKASSLLRLEELEGAYRFALRTDNEYGRSKRLMRQTVAHWKCLDQSKAWRSWHEFCRDGLGTTRLVLAKRAMRVGCLRSSARYFAAWRQAAVEGRVAERQRLALWKWQRACQKLLNAKQGVSLS